MGQLKIETTDLQDVKLLTPQVFGDQRGFFTEAYSQRDFQAGGINYSFVQDNHSWSSKKGILRGLHFQNGQAAQTKLVRVVSGMIWDVIVDLRDGSPTYLKWQGYLLSEINHRQLLIPKGFAHGFVTLTDNVNFLYKCDNYYDAQADAGISYLDEQLNIEWPVDLKQVIVSTKDAHQPRLSEFLENNPFVYGEI